MRALPFVAALVLVVWACSSDDARAPAGPPTVAAPTSDAGGTSSPDGGGPPRVATSGTRLQMMYWDTDGASIFDHVVDTKTGVACAAGVAEDGAVRCLPTTRLYSGSQFFSDAACTTQIAPDDGCSGAPPPPYAYEYTRPADARPKAITVRAVVTASPATPSMIYTTMGGGCRAASAPAPGLRYWTVGAAVAATDFAALTTTTEAGSAAVGRRVRLGDDGSRQPLAIGDRDDVLFDVARGKACHATLAADGTTRCLPILGSADPEVFGDATCTTRVAGVRACVSSDEQDATVAGFLTRPTTACSFATHVAPLGAKRAAPDTWSSASGTCKTAITFGDVYDLGAELAPTSFRALAPTTPAGSRIAAPRIVEGGVVVQESRHPVDTTLGVECHFDVAADGKTRCLPLGTGGRYFSDAACTMGVTVTTCLPVVKYGNVVEEHGCQAKLHVHALGESRTAPPGNLYMGGGGACQRFFAGDTPSVITPFGAEVDPSTFAEATLVAH